MGKVHELPIFKASISSQGSDKHIHLPRKMYPKFKDLNGDGKINLLNKKFKVKILLEELD